MDDEPGIREAFKLYLKEYKYKVYTAGGQTKAIYIIYTHSIDIALIDLRLDKISGIQLAKKLLCIKPHLKVIFMSAKFRACPGSRTIRGYRFITKDPEKVLKELEKVKGKNITREFRGNGENG